MDDMSIIVRNFRGSNYQLEIMEVVPGRPTAAVYLGTHLLGIWGLERIGIGLCKLAEFSESEVDLLGTTILLRKLSGELSCP